MTDTDFSWADLTDTQNCAMKRSSRWVPLQVHIRGNRTRVGFLSSEGKSTFNPRRADRIPPCVMAPRSRQPSELADDHGVVYVSQQEHHHDFIAYRE